MTTLSLCMIAKDEEKWISELLEWTTPFVDEIIVSLDHRTTDKTREILEKHQAKIIDFTWVDDFSASRNASLAPATSDWILVLDADERISPDDLTQIKKLISATDHDAFFLPQRNYTNNSKLFGWTPNDSSCKEAKGTGYTDNPLIRLFRNNKGIRFSNPVHEVVDESLRKIKSKVGHLTYPMHHYGNLKKEEDLDQKKEMYLAISKKQIEADSSNPRPYYEAAKVLKSQNKFEEAKLLLEKAAALDPKYQLVLTNLADVYNKLGEKNLAVQTYLRSIKVKPRNENAYINLSILLFKDGKHQEASSFLKKAILLNPKSAAAYHNLFLVLLQRKHYLEAYILLEQAIAQTGLSRFIEAKQKLEPRMASFFSSKTQLLQSMLDKHPYNLIYTTQLGHLMFAQKKFKDAADLFSSTISHYVKDKELTVSKKKDQMLIFNMFSNLALAYEKLNDKGSALSTLQQALALHPPQEQFFKSRIASLS